jgi:hypothetical protein
MININKALKNNRILKSLTGLNIEKFKELVPYFETILNEENGKRIENDKNRQRKAGGGSKSTLDSSEAKLFYILFYVKVYPTFDVAGFIFDVNRSQTNRWMHQLLPMLEKALDRRVVLPKRRIENVEAFIKSFPEVKDLFIDGTERRVERSSDNKKQRLDYSGKKKAHTRKNLVVNDEKRRIILVTPTVKGSMHDKKIYDKYGLGDTIPKDVTQWVDTGFQGIQNEYDVDVQIPKKNTKKKKLTFEEKENNKIISGIRVINEHAIGGIKRMRAINDVYRNRKGNTDDKLMIVSAGIWNLFIA